MYLQIRIQKKGVKLLLGLSPIMCSKKKKATIFIAVFPVLGL